MRIPVAIWALALLLPAGPAVAEPLQGVVELFTSQGCSSCPPADKILAEYARQPGFIALSMPVDYWDYLGWKDTLANPAYTARQKAYSEARGDRDIYTPQAVVNGLADAVGSNRTAIASAISQTRGQDGALSVPVSISHASDGYSVALGKGSAAGEVWVLAIEHAATVSVGRGENSGATLTYSNTVRSMHKLRNYSGDAVSFTLPASATAAPGADSFAILVQARVEGHPGAILGAAIEGPAQTGSN